MLSKTGLIVGGSGQLGKHVVDVFKRKGWRIMNMDFTAHDKADSNFILNKDSKI